MSAEDWLRAAKAEEQRLLGEIAKTDLYKQLETVRAVLAVYSGGPSPPVAEPAQPPAAAASAQANGPASERGSKLAEKSEIKPSDPHHAGSLVGTRP
jgi:hypothetical protein